MKLSVFDPALAQMSLEEACKYLHDSGVQAIEIGCGGFPGDAHCKPRDLLAHPEKIDEMLATLKKYDLDIAAFSVHGNAIHPDKEIAAKFQSDFEQTVLLAEKMGVTRIITFSGCPGGCPEDKTPNWVTCPWPDDFSEILKYQWNDVLIPYWKKTGAWAESHGIKQIAFEMHPGFCVYNPETMMRIRKEVGPILGANFDPSHLFWQGIDPVYAIRYLGDAIYFFHAKDTRIDEINTKTNGVLDTKHYADEIHRSWIFRSVGYGHDYQTWKVMSMGEGLQKAIAFLKEVMIFEEKGGMWWA